MATFSPVFGRSKIGPPEAIGATHLKTHPEPHLPHTPIQTPQFDLTHTLLPIYNDLKVFPTLKALKQSPLYAQHGPEIERVSNGVAWQNHVHDPGLRDAIRVVVWNIERGLCLDGILHVLQTNNVLNQADILLITETDIGMGRSGNRNVPLELAEALNLNYCFANSFLSLEKGDVGEQDHALPNTLALPGITILSRFKIDASQVLSLPPAKDLFTDLEKRLGTRKALICRIAINNQPYDFAVIHLELASTSRQRAGQMEPLLQALQTSNAKAQLIGGDWNTTTYNLVNKRGLAKNLLHKAIRVQFSGAIAHYMTPERIFERPLFDLLKTHGYAVAPTMTETPAPCITTSTTKT